ncbi:MAG: hypothetical protein PVI11_00745 [Candidatus Aminicenantes bacterium]|jgi:hypothetical protein
MKTCPHCDGPVAETESTCPACGKPYWHPGLPPPEESEQETEEEAGGCLPILFWPLTLSLFVTSALILLGFLIHIFTRFQDNQIKVIWILCSCVLGGIVYLVLTRVKRKKS